MAIFPSSFLTKMNEQTKPKQQQKLILSESAMPG
jgi:hypothetical protein